MSNLKAIKAHAAAVGNIQKITNTIKMVASSHFLSAERRLRQVRVFGQGTMNFYRLSSVQYDIKDSVYAVVTGDRGLCGGIHGKVTKKVKQDLQINPAKGGIICIGEKGKNMLAQNYKNQFRLVVNGIGSKGPTFKNACLISSRIFGNWNLATLTYAAFNNIMHSDVHTIHLMTHDLVEKSSVPFKYEIEVTDDLEFYFQFSSASLIFYSLQEMYVSELANRIISMSAASKNASKVRKVLMNSFNKLRQNKITMEMNDIVSGVKATDKKKRKVNILLYPEISSQPQEELPQDVQNMISELQKTIETSKKEQETMQIDKMKVENQGDQEVSSSEAKYERRDVQNDKSGEKETKEDIDNKDESNKPKPKDS